MTFVIQLNDRVYYSEHPEYGYGVVRLIEESVLSDERICHVAFEWFSGLVSVQDTSLVRVPKLESGCVIQPKQWGELEELQRRLSAALVIGENNQASTFIRSFATPLPHQAYLVDKILTHGRLGHLIADDVGMGKTIEAGLIVARLRERDPKCRVLVMCPAGVVLQWQDEMDEHFGLKFSIAGRDFAVKRAANWDSHSLILASIDTLKQEHLRKVITQAPNYDLIICDEAHRLTAKRSFLSNDLYRTQNYRFIEWLVKDRIVNWEKNGDGSLRSPRLILMSATPHQGDQLRFAYLLQLIRPDKIQAEEAVKEGGNLENTEIIHECLTRTPKKSAVDWSGKSIFIGHVTRTIDVPMTDEERVVLNRLTNYVQGDMVFKNSKGEALVRALAMHTFQKIAASSWAALESALLARLRKAEGLRDAALVSEEAATNGEEFDFLGGEAERKALETVIQMVSSLGAGSKWREFQSLIQPGAGFREEGDKILIFTQYRITQEWLAAKLSRLGEKVMQIHGGMSIDERRAQRIAFECGGTVMISTEAGSEGANLHRQCHLMVNFDLPWNPMRLLQRIGRLDRYGQKHQVKVANLNAPESWDAQISKKIEQKLTSVQKSMGLVADEDYHSMILGSIHDRISVPKLIESGDWQLAEPDIDHKIEDQVKNMLINMSSTSVYGTALGMPLNYGEGSPKLDSDDFRQAFTWAASSHGTMLREARNSDNKILKGVYYFNLPDAYRSGLRPTRECFLVFDREQYAEVRHANLGRVRGQAIHPTLAGFGDLVTDWFFKSALQASNGPSYYRASKNPDNEQDQVWWIIYSASWKTESGWSGPDSIYAYALDEAGEVIQPVKPQEIINTLKHIEPSNEVAGEKIVPDLSNAFALCRQSLREVVDVKTDGKNLRLQPLCLVLFE